MRIYNSLTNQIESFKPINEGKVSMYVCGPTVYNFVHIGNMRPVVVFDTFRRFLTYIGYDVKYVSNYTDVDDKIIKRAIELNMPESEVTKMYIEAFEEDLKNINALKPNVTPRVTEYMNQIIDFIDCLVKHGSAYVVDGDVYFRVEKIKDYGKLSNTRIEDLLVGARIDENSKKESPLDFTLWKHTDIGIKWDSPWSKGRPGWHTECVVMINSLFKNGHIDIHGGGFDLKFPHHENEIAQSEAINHHAIANYWMHNGFININNEKMSKSVGNVVTAHDALKKYGGNSVRLLLISTHYRAPVNFSEDLLLTNAKELTKITNVMKQLAVLLQLNDIGLDGKCATFIEPFLNALADDLNTANALSELYNVIRQANQAMRTKEVDLKLLEQLFATIRDEVSILGLNIASPTLNNDDKKLLIEYNLAKANKDYATSDSIRSKLIERNIL
ncbi:MAG: cysteine--tRNA ligase [Erysipelotrichaceae bacterium]|nr:cysteine--tRNA ligase [Erysipelotrichaceae bacterium]